MTCKQALACAEPLLALDRSEGERRSYVETLRGALQSDAISEIMTTPLQAHIMAVIVRDGGKPPERKWQLFNTFYEIIKKREANRNLPDKKLATLLREGDQLLKALHNRLGFELHARAETSQGAATSLDRNELLTIVRDVVSQLQDNDVAETVATLMRATTERLVLVSTPETGDHVRFDIRPLQEFFAAEHIYQSGEPSFFIERVRVIAGDSHWREVVHFLLSALIENNRKSELAAAIAVLVQIDNGGEGGERILNRRLARGAIIAARLLQEGVLEQDKRIREQFRNCVLPLIGCVDADQYFSEVKSSHSTQWIIDVLTVSLREQSESETIGATTSLALLLPDSDPRSKEIKNVLLSATFDYQRFFLEEVRSHFEANDSKKPSRWLVECVLLLLLQDDWWRLGSSAISSAFIIIGKSGATIGDIALDCGIDPNIAKIASSLLSPSKPTGRPTRTEKKHGLVTVSYYRPPPDLKWTAWSKALWSALRESPGILGAIYWLFELLRTGNKKNLTQFLVSIGGACDNFRLLPDNVRVFITTTEIRKPPERLRASDLLDRTNPGFLKVWQLTGRTITKVDFLSAFKEEPWLIFYLLATNHAETSQVFQDTKFQSQFIKFVPKQLLLTYIPSWGLLFSLPGSAGRKIRKLALDASDQTVESDVFLFSRWSEFKINLPTEAPMLPHLLAGLVEYVQRARVNFDNAEPNLPPRKEIGRRIAKYVPAYANIKATAASQSLSKRVRAAALIVCCLHPDFDGLTIPNELNSSDLYDPNESRWFLPAIALVLTDAISANQTQAIETMGNLLRCAAADFSGRRALNSSIRVWRELAGAPVQHLATPGLWR